MPNEHINRRSFLRCAVGAASSMGLAGIASAGEDARLQLFNSHTREFLDVIYRRGERYDREALAQIDFLMRDHRQNIAAEMDVKLIEIMHSLHIASGKSGPFTVISGFRTAKTNEMLRNKNSSTGVAKNSYHMYAQAADLFIPGVSTDTLAKHARGLGLGGVGKYNGKGFIHVDTGPVRSWGS